MQLAKKITITSNLIKKVITPRMKSSKKGDNGIVLIVGGSRIYHGAPILASMAALRSGTDLVYTAIPRSILVAVRCFSPNLIALPMPDDKLTVGSVNKLIKTIPRNAHSAAIGMGMSIAKSEALLSLIRQLKNNGTKLLLDASALIPDVLKEISGTNTIITPHIGEYKRIFSGDNISEVITENERISNVHRFARKYGITILLKGSVDIISDGEEVAINKIHNCAMTVGGTGDVLSGLTAGFLSKLKPFDACILGVYFNGVAGNLVYNRLGLHMVASDLIESLPKAMRQFDLTKQ
jgi:ADP-dependent NAD(P)H-hydrate dehydratase